MTHEDGKLVDNEANAEIGKTHEETFTFSVELYACAPQQYVLAGLDERRPWQHIYKTVLFARDMQVFQSENNY